MNNAILSEIVLELRQALVGGALGKIYQLSRSSFAIDFRRPAGFLFLDVEASSPRLYLIRRTTRQLEKSSQPLGEFGHSLRANLNGAVLQEISKDDSERVVRFRFERQEETGETRETTLVAQLTGRSANLLLLNELEAITHSQRALQGLGQQAGDRYQLPKSDAKTPVNKASFEKGEFESLSAAADSFYQAVDLQRLFDTDAALARNQLRQELMKLEKLGKRLQGDLTS